MAIVAAAHAAQDQTQDRRSILALYDSTDKFGGTAEASNAHMYMEMPLNHLGLAVDYWDARARPLPEAQAYRGIIVWFSDNRLPEADGYYEWLASAMQAGVRVLFMDGIGIEADPGGRPVQAAELQRVLYRLGLRQAEDASETTNPFVQRYRDDNPGAFGFETETPATASFFQVFEEAGNHPLKPWRTIERTDKPGLESLGIGTSPAGGWIADQELALRIVPKPYYRVQWDLDPFEFLQTALDCRELARPDVTTCMGLRAAFSHIDGDGQENVTVDIPGKARFASEVILEEILTRYPVPVCVGLIAGRVDPAGAGDPANLPLWRKIMAQPNVQPGCHGYAHPMSWEQGRVGVEFPGYEFSERRETVDAMECLREQILPAGRRVEVFLWTGDCAPSPSALALVAGYGAANLNGGTPRLDALCESITHLPAMTRPVGAMRQVRAASCNEYIYTDNWTENHGGFVHVLETYKRTERPRRLLPVNIYYHFYSGERQASLNALKTVYDWALAQPLCWIHAAEYARSVEGALKARTGRTADHGYWVSDYGACLTVRLDQEPRHVDLTRSKNVLGYNHHNRSLYVTLQQAPRAEFHLAKTPARHLSLKSSTALLREVTLRETAFSARARLYAPGRIVLQGLAANAVFQVCVGAATHRLGADADGLLTIELPQGRGEWTEVSLGP